tara:strand:- start:382 stop:609 length:228 start_codon:yes stop_codon:yes gene_type:complete
MEKLIELLNLSKQQLTLQIMLAEICDGDMDLHDTLCKSRHDLDIIIDRVKQDSMFPFNSNWDAGREWQPAGSINI